MQEARRHRSMNDKNSYSVRFKQWHVIGGEVMSTACHLRTYRFIVLDGQRLGTSLCADRSRVTSRVRAGRQNAWPLVVRDVLFPILRMRTIEIHRSTRLLQLYYRWKTILVMSKSSANVVGRPHIPDIVYRLRPFGS